MRLKIFFLGLLIAFSHTILSATAAESPAVVKNKSRPKVCLVLSGGGARGAAHIGVLKVLEELRIPVDCITGTSMGALVGAAYATGTTIPEMNAMTKVISTRVLIKENPPREELSIRRKIDDYSIFVGPEIGVKNKKFSIGKGLVSGVQLETVLRKLSKAKGYRNFDDLPIPFRAVATDLLTGKPVVFSEGELANVMRASMSLPGVVVPVEMNGMMLVDGMLTSNLPIEAARAMGAEVIIAVNVGSPLLTRDQMTGLLSVGNQMVNILTDQNVHDSIAQLKKTDILISPELGDYSTSDFDELEKIAPLGENAALEVSAQLKKLSLSESEYAALRARQTVTIPSDLSPVDKISFVNLNLVNPEYLQSLMSTQPDQDIIQDILDRDMRWLYGTGDFEHVNYKIIQNDNNERILEVEAIEKPWGPDYLRFGLGLSSDFKGGAYFNLLASYRKTWLNYLGAEWRTDLQVGRNTQFISEFFQPLNVKQYFFVAPHIALDRHGMTLYQKRDRVASYDVFSALAGIDLGSLFFRYGQLRIGFEKGIIEPKLDTGSEFYSPGDKNISQGAFTAKIILDQIDSLHFPRSGWRGAAKIYHASSTLGADDLYTKWEADGNAAYSLGAHTINVGAHLGGKIGSDNLPRYDLFSWGGFLEQSGYKSGQLLGENLKFGRFMYYHRVMTGTLLDGAYAGISLEAGKVGNPLVSNNPSGLLKSASVFLAIDSPLGPVYLGYGRADDSNNSFYFYLGRPV
jgi:NTE family protein